MESIPSESSSSSDPNPISIAALGSVALDTIETPTDRRDRILGGSATYFAAAARLSAAISIVSAVGEDFGADDEAVLRELDIDTTMLDHLPGHTYAWHGRYGADYANATTVRRDTGVIDGYSPRPGAASGHRGLFLGAMDPSIQCSLLDSSPGVGFTALDSREAWIEEAPELVMALAAQVDYAFLNSFELSALTGRDAVKDGAEVLLQGGTGCVVVKQGADGAALYTENRTLTVPACKAVVVDPTGAGDAFAGGFMGVLVRSEPLGSPVLLEALRFGAAMASFALESFGIEALAGVSPQDVSKRAASV